MTDDNRGVDRAGRRKKRLLSPSEKYEIWLQLLRGEVTQNEAAQTWQVDRSTVMRIRQVAKEGALAALSQSRPGRKARERDFELELANAEIARLSEAVKELAVKLTLLEEKSVGVEWPHPPPGRRGHQAGTVGSGR